MIHNIFNKQRSHKAMSSPLSLSRVGASLMLLSLLPLSATAADYKGRVVDSANKPVADVVITSPGCKAVRTDADGRYVITGVNDGAVVTFRHEGYYVVSQSSKLNPVIHLIETDNRRYDETVILPFDKKEDDQTIVNVQNVNRKDFQYGSLSIDNALKGEVTGLNVTSHSGMTGEGSYLQLRGIKTLVADNEPLIVINGVPYMPDLNESQIIGGYSRSAFQALNNQDIRNITVLKGADAAIYGSLGSNGVIMIETDQATSTDMDTRISFNALYGYNWNNRRIPMMDATQYKSYLSDIGLTYYDNMESFFGDFSFLFDPDANNAYLYKHNTNWQDEIMRNSNTMDLLFRVEGGDAIAKYNISLGYLGDNGTLRNTNSDRYNAQINASILVSKKFEILANINTAYLTGKYQEQGLSLETNPLLAAYRRSPLLSPYASDMYGNLISTYNSYWYGAIENTDFQVSNPLSLVNSLMGKNRQYDLNAKVQLNYRPINGMTISGAVGMYYNYNQEETFIPGINNSDIVPLFDQYGEADNSTRVGTNHAFNLFFTVNADYKFQLQDKHKFDVKLGAQSLLTDCEYDAAFGRNSNNDFYQTLGDAQTIGKYFSGYNNKWNWLNLFAHADYTFDDLLKAGVTVSYDGSSSTANGLGDFAVYPAGELVLMAKNLKALNDIDFINKLNVYVNLSLTGNSRFSSKLGTYYYTSTPYQTIAGVVRANLPSKLKAERDRTINAGIETALWNNRVQLGIGYYDVLAKDVIMYGQNTAVLGTSPYYTNNAKLTSHGLELSLTVAPVYTHDFRWTIGGKLTTLTNKVKALGAVDELITTLSDDAQIITRVGEDPYAFYGYQSTGVFATTAEANQANLYNQIGQRYEAGDVHYVDQNGDGVINDNDRVILGSATPDAFGSIFTRFDYKGFALDLTFGYSLGNEAYNAVRRITESGSDFSNQSTSMTRRWSMEGQVTDIPRVSYGDKIGNNDFSDRWIEDASYLKLRDITFSYTWNKPLLDFLQGGTIYVTGQNLFCFTSYLGLDPEFSYSNTSAIQGVDYAKINNPRSIKFGVNLKF